MQATETGQQAVEVVNTSPWRWIVSCVLILGTVLWLLISPLLISMPLMGVMAYDSYQGPAADAPARWTMHLAFIGLVGAPAVVLLCVLGAWLLYWWRRNWLALGALVFPLVAGAVGLGVLLVFG